MGEGGRYVVVFQSDAVGIPSPETHPGTRRDGRTADMGP